MQAHSTATRVTKINSVRRLNWNRQWRRGSVFVSAGAGVGGVAFDILQIDKRNIINASGRPLKGAEGKSKGYYIIPGPQA